MQARMIYNSRNSIGLKNDKLLDLFLSIYNSRNSIGLKNIKKNQLRGGSTIVEIQLVLKTNGAVQG